MALFLAPVTMVALRKESVDRKFDVLLNYKEVLLSLSARRAWIENFMMCSSLVGFGVALRKESVDRKRSYSQFLY